MSSKKQRKILFWAHFWRSFQFISLIPLLMGEIGMIISAICLSACGIYGILGVRLRWQSAHCIAQTLGRRRWGNKGRDYEMKVRNYAWSDEEKGGLIALGIIDMVCAVIFVVGWGFSI